MNKSLILIVDDDADDREILRDAFIAANNNASHVMLENGDQLLLYLTNHTDTNVPALIMLDLNMPGKDGRETLREVKSDKRFQSIPIIVFTTSSSYRDKQMVYDAGANCFITKPDTFNKLVNLTDAIMQLWISDL